MQRGAAAEPFLPARFGKAAMTVEQARSWCTSIQDVRAGAQVSAHGIAGQSGPVRDLQNWKALRPKTQDVVEAPAAVLAPLRQGRRGRGHGGRDAGRSPKSGSLLDLPVVPRHDGAECFGGIDQKVPSVAIWMAAGAPMRAASE